MNSDVTGDDRISKLPEPILHHILSFLRAKDAARMSTLSKAWDTSWNSLPYLDFGDIFDRWSKGLYVVIDQTLASRKKHKISMQRFSLWLGYYVRLSYVDRRIKILIACNIKELNLRVERHDYLANIAYSRLPNAIFAAKSLNVLSLCGFKIELPADVGRIKLSSLRLEVDETLPKLKKIDLVNLKRGCSVLQMVHIDIAATNLEDLKIDDFYGNIKTVKIASDSLKQLTICGCNNLIDVDLDTPNIIKILCFNEKFTVCLD
ncbi:putative F-box/FBD/LRR-repeat protein [Capsicum galapagoense]